MALNNIEKLNSDRRRFVLIVDGSERNQRFLSSLLNRFDYKPYAVKSLRDARAIATVISPLLILTARNLDDGNDAIALIRSFRSDAVDGNAPIIVLTTRPDPAFERDCLNAGAVTCLRAPIALENFYRVIQVAIEPVPRMTIRISTNLPVSINGARSDECVQDISENGAYVLTSRPYPLNTKLPVRIRLSDCMVTADAVVIYVRQSGNGSNKSGMGLQFARISDEDQQRIRVFIRNEMAQGIQPLGARR